MTILPGEISSSSPNPEERVSYEDRIDQLHHSREVFFITCSRFLDRPTNARGDVLGETGTNFSKDFMLTVRAIADDPSLIDDRDKLVAGLFVAEDANIVSFYNNLATFQLCKYYGRSVEEITQSVAGIFSQHGDDPELAMVNLARVFASDFGRNTLEFVKFSQERAQSKRSMVARSIGSAAFDISKFAIGTGVGIWFMNRNRHGKES